MAQEGCHFSGATLDPLRILSRVNFSKIKSKKILVDGLGDMVGLYTSTKSERRLAYGLI